MTVGGVGGVDFFPHNFFLNLTIDEVGKDLFQSGRRQSYRMGSNLQFNKVDIGYPS